ncbi:MAG: hypothetical protein HOP30_21660, partial [Cyclobacteriaceae bacterium]|nr:hypothetical protein [Cyclobacteriaceae bacterium]
MYQRIDFPKTDGFPFDQETFDFMQKSFRDCFAGIAAHFGHLVIVSGVDDLGANWGDGWVVIAGELLPFVGGTKAGRVVIQETTEDALFED